MLSTYCLVRASSFLLSLTGKGDRVHCGRSMHKEKSKDLTCKSALETAPVSKPSTDSMNRIFSLLNIRDSILISQPAGLRHLVYQPTPVIDQKKEKGQSTGW